MTIRVRLNQVAVLRAIAGAVVVEEKRPNYQELARYAPSKDAVVEAPQFIQDWQFISEEAATEMDADDAKQQAARLGKENATMRKELDELKAKIVGLTATGG